MIFVTVGTQKFQLNRLLSNIDELVKSKSITETIFAQVGHSDYRPKYYEFTTFMAKEEFETKIDQCNLLITHCGIGTILSGMKKNKPILVYPRLDKYKEHVDNHQLEIAKAFSELNYIVVCKEDDDLKTKIADCKNFQFSSYISQREKMIRIIDDFLHATESK